MASYDVDEILKNIFDHDDPSWKPSDKIPLIVKELEFCKDELKTFLVSSEYDIQNIISESEELCSESSLLVENLEICSKEIVEETMAEIVKSMENHDNLSKELLCVSFATDLVGDVIKCGRYVKEFNEGREQQSFMRSIEAVCELVQYLEMPTDGFDVLDIAIKTTETAQLILDNLIHELYSEWSRILYWEVKPSYQQSVVNITVEFNHSSNCCDLLKALELSRKLSEKVNEFSQFLYKDVLKPMINNECSVDEPSNHMISITISHLNNKPLYVNVLENLQKLFQFLSNKLDINFKGDPNTTPMIILGRELRNEFANVLVENCLKETIPNNIADLQAYRGIIEEIEKFQEFLVKVKFFSTDNTISILKYVDDINILFAEKASRSFLEKARTIMLKDLSDTMSIGVLSIPDEPSSNASDNEVLNVLENTFPKSLFYFPRCMISKSAQELLDLVHMMMEHAVQCPDVVCKKLYCSTRMVFELYDAVVPYHHEKYLQTIPQYVALFHNNCMFLGHNMLTFGDKWLQLAGVAAHYPVSFVDLAHKLRALGCRLLAEHMQHQRKQILDNIRSSDLNCIVVKDELGEDAEAAVRQCLRQLQLLKNVWRPVFPANVFLRLMGTLVNMFVEELIHRVCTVEDVSMEMAAQLTDIYSLVVQKAPSLFVAPEPSKTEEQTWSTEDMQKYVVSWTKLTELIFVLKGSLRDIESHWADGTGPLAVHFRTEELRNLIKALFQNTQIRANLLSKIK